MEYSSFYEELETLKKEYTDASFMFLELEKTSWHHDAYEFLHGYCHTFAYTLSREKGYPIILRRLRFPEKGEPDIIHTWCENQGQFIDVRGKTDNWKEFWEEFEDWDDFDMEDDTFETLRFENANDFFKFLGGEDVFDPGAQHFISAAKTLYLHHPDYY